MMFSVSKLVRLVFCRSMHNLLHTSTSCHFKICLESHYLDNGWARPYCAVLGYSFILRFCIRWDEGSLYNSLTFSGEAHGFSGLSVTSLFQILDQCDLTDYEICFVQIGEMMSVQLRMTRSVLILPSACAD